MYAQHVFNFILSCREIAMYAQQVFNFILSCVRLQYT